MIGETISHYRIVEKLGEGGMGVVYIAEDTVLGRRVAIKTLTAARGLADQHFRMRFLREARAVSTLSHPHIATIYDYGETVDGQPYIVMELVKGQTLSALMASEVLTIPRAIEIVKQVAEALAEAHRHGIVHRDIKPSNIAINERGDVKVLDFGLAKQMASAAVGLEDASAQALLNTQTREGVIIGTPMYLSPEQALGVEVDARSDLFSLGSVLYECIAGQPAFAGTSALDICAKVIRDDPADPASLNKSIPSQLSRITLKTLAKKPEERYQSAEELITELRTTEISFPHSFEFKRASKSLPTALETIGTLPSFKNLYQKKAFLLAFVMLVVATVLLFVLMRPKPATTVPQLELTRLAISGNVKEATISPDGKYVASVIYEAGMQSLLIRQINTASELQIVPPSEEQYKGLSFSPSGDHVYYMKKEGDTGALYRVSVLGGSSRRLASNVDTPVTFSPQGDLLAFVRLAPNALSTSLVVANSEGAEQRTIATLTAPQLFSRGGFYSSGPAWSPDGSVIAVPAYGMTDGSHRDVVAVRVTDGVINVVNIQKWTLIEKLVWLADSKGLLMNAADETSSPLQIWLLPYPKGEAVRVTKDPNYYFGLSSSKDSKTLLTTKNDSVTALWIMSSIGDVSPSQITSSKYLGRYGICWTSDGKIVISSSTSGKENIWVMTADGGNRRQLTFNDRVNVEPTVSPDGHYIVFVSFDGRHPHLWRMDMSGADPKQLTSGGDEDLPQFTPDGGWIVYHSIDGDKYSIRKISIEGGDPLVLTKEYSTQPDVSPDGKLIAYFSRPNEGDSPLKIAVISQDGGLPVREFDLPATVDPEWPGIRWSPDGRSLTYVVTSRGVSNIWSQPLSGTAPKQLTNFRDSQIFNFAWSFRTGQLIFVRGAETKDLYLITHFL